MGKFSGKLARFMYGRNGVDELYKAMMIFEFVVLAVYILLNIFIDKAWLDALFTLIIFTVCGCMIFRVFSRNLEKRRKENKKYLDYKKNRKSKKEFAKKKRSERKTHVYKNCPSCKAVLRLPKKKGLHTVKCPRCAERFEVKI